MAEGEKSVGGIWIKESRNGGKFLSISVDGKSYIAFKNKLKQEGEKTPDYRIFAPREQRQDAMDDDF